MVMTTTITANEILLSDLKIGLIIPVRNRKHYTEAILAQLTQQIDSVKQTPNDKATIAIIVIDDGSSDGTPELIQQSFPQVHLLHGNGELWWAGAIAQGMAYATEQLQVHYLVWLNDDIVLTDDFIDRLIAQCHQNGTAKTITGGIIRDQTHRDWVVFGGVITSQLITTLDPFQENPVLQVDTLNGNIALMPASVVTDLGLPDIKRFRHYGGDYEYICRAKAAGYKIQLSSYLQASTDYKASDVIRYMPLWMQLYLSPTWSQKWQVFQNLTNRKSPHNVEHMVNSIYRSQPQVPRWKYAWFYAKKLVKLFGSEWVPRSVRRQWVETYLQKLHIPTDMAHALLENRHS